jgi:hypothetical protein
MGRTIPYIMENKTCLKPPTRLGRPSLPWWIFHCDGLPEGFVSCFQTSIVISFRNIWSCKSTHIVMNLEKTATPIYTGWWWLSHPSEKYESQLGLFFPIYGKIKNAPTTDQYTY